MSLVLSGSTSGSVTLQEPAVAGTTVLDLPATSGTILTSASAISASSITTGTLPKAQLPTGSVLQVVSTAKTDTFSESVAAGAISGDVTGLTAAITPSTATNKILVNVTVCASVPSNPTFIYLYVNGSASPFVGNTAGSRARVSVSGIWWNDDTMNSYAFSFLHSPSSTSAQTYSIRLGHASGLTRTIYVNRSVNDTDSAQFNRNASSITAMEIAYEP